MWHPVDARTGEAIFILFLFFFFPKLTVNDSNFG